MSLLAPLAHGANMALIKLILNCDQHIYICPWRRGGARRRLPCL
jgi:hypothetical protein